MAVAVRNTYQSASWFTSGTLSTTISWQDGDVIVVLVGQENASNTISGVTATGLTFTSRQVTTGTGTGNAYCRAFTAKATGAGTNVTCTATRSAGTLRNGMIVFVLSGANDYGSGFANGNETTQNLTVGAGDFVCTLTSDWDAGAFTAAAATGSGTGSVVVDVNDTNYAGHYVCQWVNTSSGTFAFGLNSYSGLATEQVGIAITAAATGTTATPAVVTSAGTVPAATPSSTATSAPAVFASSSTVGAATPSTAVTAAPAAVAASAGFGTPAPTATATGAPAAFAAAGTVGSATPSTTAVPSPAAVVASSTVGAATPTIDRTAAPDAFAAAGTVPAPTASTSSDATATPAAFAAATTVGAPTPTDAVTASPTAAAAPSSVGAPTATADSTAAVSAVAVGGTIGAPTADTGGTVAAPASVVGTAVVRTDFAADNKWASIKNDFDYPATGNFATSGVAPTYIGGKVRWDMGGSDGAIRDLVDRDLTGSYVALLVEPNPSYGYVEFQITRNGGSTIVGSVYKRADTNVLNIYYNGSVRATPTWDATAMARWRWRETGGTLHLETSPDGAVWTSRWSDSDAATTFDLTTIEVVVNGGAGVGGVAPSTGSEYAYVSKFNILPVATVATPAAVVGTGTVGTPTPTHDGAAAPAAVAGTAVVPPAGVSVTGPLTVNAGAVGASAVVPAPTALAEVTPTPAAIEAAATVPLPTAIASAKWQYVTCNFDDFIGDIFAYGGTTTIADYVGNRCRFNVQTGADGYLRDFTDRDLTDSHVLLRVEPNTSYGYLEFQIAHSSGATIIGSSYVRADTGLLYVFYNGSVRTTLTYSAATHAWWRWREAGGTLYFETSANGWAWTERWSDAGAGGVFDLTAVEVVISSGGNLGGGAPSAQYGYISRFNLPEAVPDTAEPASVVGSGAVPLPGAGDYQTVTPGSVVVNGVVPWEPSGAVDNLTLIQGVPFAFPATVPTPGVAVPFVTPTPGAVGAVAFVGAPAVAAPQTAAPTAVTGTGTVPAATPSTDTTPAPVVVGRTSTVGSPSVTATATPTPAALAVAVTIPLATTPGSSIASPAVVGRNAVVNLPAIDAEDGPGIGWLELGALTTSLTLGPILTQGDLADLYEGE